jgi:hypothetical protein
LTDVLFEILDDRKLSSRSGIPEDILERLEKALSAPGEGADHAICETTTRLNWLFYLDPVWVTKRVIPMFSIESNEAEPAWNGFFHNSNLGVPDLFSLLKSNFLRLFEYFSDWRWDDMAISQLHKFLVIACYWHRKSGRYVEYSEVRLALQRTNDDGRSHALWLLASIISEEGAWRSFGKAFVTRAWPREARFQTSATSRQFASIAEASGDDFPDVVHTLSPFLVPSTQLDLFVYKTTVKGDELEDAARLPGQFPNAMLGLLDRLVPHDPNLAPHELGSLLETIADANSSLRQDPRWRRLNQIVHAR